MRRFFVDSAAISGDEAMLTETESHHLSRVLRLAKGDGVVLFDGSGAVYEGAIIEIGNRTRVKILSRHEEDAGGEPFGRPLIIAQAILRGVKMDDITQRYTELGVDTLIPIWSNRCQGSFDVVKESERQGRQQRIIAAACKQSGRARPLRLENPKSFAGFLADCGENEAGWRRLLFWEDEATTGLGDVAFTGAKGVVALIGPAGGWAPEEVAMARARDFRTVRLAGHILRAETAGLTVAALCQFLLGNI